MIDVIPISLTNSREKKIFVNFAYKIYENNPNWVAPLKMDINQRLNPKKHPFYKFGQIQCFMAKKNGEWAGRIAAISNPNYNEFHGTKVGFFGFFECINDLEVAKALLNAAKHWLVEKGYAQLQGPVNPSTNYESGLLIDGFDSPPKMMMSYNPTYYSKLLEENGLKLTMRMFAYELNENDVLKNEKFMRIKDIALTRSKCKLRWIDKSNLKKEVEFIKKIYNKAWENNWGFVPMTDPELDLMAKELSMIIDPELGPMIENEKGEVVGFALAMRDINELTIKFKGNLFPFNFLKLILGKSKIKWIRVLLLGILPEYRNKGLDAVMYYEIIKNGMAMGIKKAEASWILESNPAMMRGVEVVNGKIYKTYGIYEQQLS